MISDRTKDIHKKLATAIIVQLIILCLPIISASAATKIDLETTSTEHTILTSGDYIASNYSGEHSLRIPSGVNVNLEIKDISIDVSRYLNRYAICVDYGGTLNLTVTGTNALKGGFYCAALQAHGTLVITESSTGTLYAYQRSEGAAIGGARLRDAGKITINGGTIIADRLTGFTRAAAIGGGSRGPGSDAPNASPQNNGEIIINGGNVTAYAYLGAGIGGGCHQDSGKITINGGVVNASGATGIGAGSERSCNEITIANGDITAQSTFNGAGIGANTGSIGQITIDGGTIRANGSTYGAGIGGGLDSPNEGIITINSGNIYATSISGAGIGGGYNANHSSGSGIQLSINGGVITAQSEYGAGIGGGKTSPRLGGDYGSVTITGGRITATSAYSAAIGGGTCDGGYQSVAPVSAGCGGPIVISGGTIRARSSGSQRYSIGNGEYSRAPASSTNYVSITGGNVYCENGKEIFPAPRNDVGSSNGSGVSVEKIIITGASDGTRIENHASLPSTYGCNDLFTIGDSIYAYLPTTILSLSGTVLDENHLPVMDVVVLVTDASTTVTYQTASDGNGEWFVSGIIPGHHYTVAFSKPHYQFSPSSHTISAIQSSTTANTIATRIPYEYTISDNRVRLIRYLGSESSITIPDVIDGYPVRIIGSETFANCEQLEEVQIPASVYIIEPSAFAGCTQLKQARFLGIVPAPQNSLSESLLAQSKVFTYIRLLFADASQGMVVYYNVAQLTATNPINSSARLWTWNTADSNADGRIYLVAQKAIIVVPGICGSVLYDKSIRGYTLKWPGTNMNKLSFNADGMPTSSSIGTYGRMGANPGQYGTNGLYTNIVKRLEREFGSDYAIRFFTYDWRYGNAVATSRLKEMIDRYDSVILVAHSLGGLIVSNYVKTPENAMKVEKAITLGTPFLGSAKALNAIENGEFLDELKWTTIDNKIIKPFAKDLPSVYELLPVEAAFEPFITLLMRVNYGNYSYLSVAAAIFVPPLLCEIESYQRSSQFLSNSRAGTVNMARFNDAKTFHTGLNQRGTHEILSLGNKLYCIIGDGHETITKVKYSYASTFTHSMFEAYQQNNGWPSDTDWNADDLDVTMEGDGTVTKRSATINNTVSQVYTVEAEHSALPQNADAIDLVVSIIKNAAPSPSAATVSQRGAKLMIACPVDVQIFNSGTLVGEIMNGVVTQQDSAQVGLHVLGANYDRKLAFLNTTNKYDVVLQGTGIGTMDFFMALLAADGVTETRSIQFNDVPITASTRITTTSNPSGMVLNIDHDGNGTVDETMHPAIDMDLLRQFNIIVAPSTHGSVQLSSPTAKYGDIVTATAVADNGYRLAPGSLQFAGLDALGNVTTSFYTLTIGQFPMLYSDVIIKASFVPASASVPTSYTLPPQTGDGTPVALLLTIGILCGVALLIYLSQIARYLFTSPRPAPPGSARPGTGPYTDRNNTRASQSIRRGYPPR